MSGEQQRAELRSESWSAHHGRRAVLDADVPLAVQDGRAHGGILGFGFDRRLRLLGHGGNEVVLGALKPANCARSSAAA